MRIGVNALFLIPGRVGGTEIYLLSVLQALAKIAGDHEFFVFRNRETGPDLIPKQSNFYDCPQPVRASFRPGRILWEQWALPRECRERKIDALFNGGFTAPLRAPCPMVTMFHDMQYRRHPEYFRWFDLPFWKLLLPWSARRSASIVVPSEDVRHDVEAFYPFARGKVRAIYHGVDERFREIARARQERSETPLLLTVSTLHPHKNLDGLLRAFARFRERHAEYKLTITGLKGFETARIEALRSSLGVNNAVEMPGWITREKLYELFGGARGFVYPSRFEGFGMPVLEALAAGIPTACSRIAPLEEIAGDAVRYFDPDEISELAQAMEDIAFDEPLRERLRIAGPARAASFSWERCAGELLEVLVKSHRPSP